MVIYNWSKKVDWVVGCIVFKNFLSLSNFKWNCFSIFWIIFPTQFGHIFNTSQSFKFGGRFSFMIFIEDAQMNIATSNWMCINFSASFVILLPLFKNPWKIHVKNFIICHSHNILLVWIGHPAIEWIKNIPFLVTFNVILCIVFLVIVAWFSTICAISTTTILEIYANESKLPT